MDDLTSRIRDTGSALLGLRAALVAGEPWALSGRWGHEPEANWGPREVLGHVNEMIPYWTEQLETVRAGDPATAVPFGRVATDQSRLDRIDADRQKSAGTLLDEIAGGLERTRAFVASLGPGDAQRLGLHPTIGELSIETSIERFFVRHLDEHVEQLRGILATRST